jgi:hypothetical protein
MAGKFYSGDHGLSEKELAAIAIEQLGLSSLNPFVKDQKIIDYMI